MPLEVFQRGREKASCPVFMVRFGIHTLSELPLRVDCLKCGLAGPVKPTGKRVQFSGKSE